MNKHVASVIKIIRKTNKLTQAELAELLDVTPGHIGSLEQGKSNPSYKIMLIMMDIFNMDANIFFGKTNQDAVAINANTIQFIQGLLSEVDENIIEFKRAFEQISAEDTGINDNIDNQ